MPNDSYGFAATDQPDEQRRLVADVRDRQRRAKEFKRPLQDRWNEEVRIWRNAVQTTNVTNPKDPILGARAPGGGVILEKRQWNADLRVPKAFRAVETIVPRAVSNMPRMVVRPLDFPAVDAADKLTKALYRQQEQINFDLTLQKAARQGFVHGLGAIKTYWHHKKARRLQQLSGSGGIRRFDETIYEGPCAELVDIFDLFWDPAAADVDGCEWIIHRLWRSDAYVKRQLEQGPWTGVTYDEIKGIDAATDRQTAQSERNEAAGLTASAQQLGKQHEVWECHDRYSQRVYTVLDQRWLVQNALTPDDHGELPFHIFRPVLDGTQFCGIGIVRPLIHLIYELNQLRGQRRDNATLSIHTPVLFTQGALPPDTKFGPATATPVRGDPREVVFPFPIKDIPASGYNEEDRINADLDGTAGISDALTGSDVNANQTTATGTQMVLEAANNRIKLMVKNLMLETVKPACCQFVYLNAQNAPVVPSQVPVASASADSGYEFPTLTRSDWQANVELIPDADSPMPDNDAAIQQQADAVYQNLSQNQSVDQGELAVWYLKKHKVPNAEKLIAKQADPNVAPDGGQNISTTIVEDALYAAGLDPQQIAAFQASVQADVAKEAAATQGQNGATPAGPPGQGPAPNGNVPQPQGTAT